MIALARRCWQADGGIPLAMDPGFLRGRWFRPGTVTFVVRDSAATGSSEGGLLAAVAVRPGPDGPVITGLVDPAARGRGIGSGLLDVALAEAGTAARAPGSGRPPSGASDPVPASVTVETEGLTPAAERLFASRGLRQFFAEDVMRIDLASAVVPEPEWAAGTEVTEWTEATAERFHAVYAAAFRERPGFPDPSAEEWIEDHAEDEDFRADWSLLASLPGVGDAGFVVAAGSTVADGTAGGSAADGTVADGIAGGSAADGSAADGTAESSAEGVSEGWIVQVGVLPAARRTGLGAALIRESLRRMAGAGTGEAWLCVNVNNPAASLYRRLGFATSGRRARYRFPADGEAGTGAAGNVSEREDA